MEVELLVKIDHPVGRIESARSGDHLVEGCGHDRSALQPQEDTSRPCRNVLHNRGGHLQPQDARTRRGQSAWVHRRTAARHSCPRYLVWPWVVIGPAVVVGGWIGVATIVTAFRIERASAPQPGEGRVTEDEKTRQL